ncbi:hypothetical protein BJ508DRAFT_334863 [Ascobolus immersus RN42]|uniref:Uncharacterized protein n=1 Tax=Ascobolus immersus RN42 TaxID=1160509 RepID=A0A3N4HJ05_ASCIM|nr:hypothetical protein BJ508DRAFT_334863 [Ascobolus immersus RN42]
MPLKPIFRFLKRLFFNLIRASTIRSSTPPLLPHHRSEVYVQSFTQTNTPPATAKRIRIYYLHHLDPPQHYQSISLPGDAPERITVSDVLLTIREKTLKWEKRDVAVPGRIQFYYFRWGFAMDDGWKVNRAYRDIWDGMVPALPITTRLLDAMPELLGRKRRRIHVIVKYNRPALPPEAPRAVRQLKPYPSPPLRDDWEPESDTDSKPPLIRNLKSTPISPNCVSKGISPLCKSLLLYRAFGEPEKKAAYLKYRMDEDGKRGFYRIDKGKRSQSG